jgi:CBS domain-containing protein
MPTLGSALAGGSAIQAYSGWSHSGQGLGAVTGRQMLDQRSRGAELTIRTRDIVSRVQLREIMTSGVISAGRDDDLLSIARLMRDHSVGSVVICDSDGAPTAMITDRDLAVRGLAEQRPVSEPIAEHASRPLVTGEPEMDLEEAAALMVQHRVRRLPVVDGAKLVGIVTLDDIAVRTGNLEIAQRMTQEVIEGALPSFFFHERG